MSVDTSQPIRTSLQEWLNRETVDYRNALECAVEEGMDIVEVWFMGPKGELKHALAITAIRDMDAVPEEIHDQ